MNRFDLTFFEDDDETPFFGTGDGNGGVTVADFSTDPAHARPYLGVVRDWSATSIDFPSGSSSIGGFRVRVADKPTDPSDQRTGILTSRLAEVVGRRALLRRLVDGNMLTAFDGVVVGYSMIGPKGLVEIEVSIKDGRERERRVPLFSSNHVLYGLDGASGPAVPYGEIPASQFTPLAEREYLLDAVLPAQSIVAGGISHFQRIFEGLGYAAGIAAGPLAGFNIPEDYAYPSQDADGVFRYRGFQIRWRPVGGDDWVTLRNMPVWAYQSAVIFSNAGLAVPELGLLFPASTTLYFSSEDEYSIPETGQAFEFQVLAVEISEDTPFWWDQGTFGDLLKEIYDGDHTLEPPRIRYDPVAMADYRVSTPRARFVLREPVPDMQAWIEENIFRPIGHAPGFDPLMRIAPASAALPSNLTSIPELDPISIVPIGEWSHSSDNVVNVIEFTYIREHIDPLRQIKRPRKTGWWIFGREWEELITDPEDDRAPWQRLVETMVQRDTIDADSVVTFGAKKLVLKPVTVRSIGSVDGRPFGGDIQDELGMQLQRHLGETFIRRFRRGAPQASADFVASDPTVQDLRLGSWLLVPWEWFPEYSAGRRGARRYMQAVSISDSEPNRRRVTLLDSGVPDPQTAGGGGATGEDCLVGGTLFPATSGLVVRSFRTPGRFEIENTCDHPVVCGLVAVAGGGGGGTTGGGGGGGGGAGGVLGGDGELEITIPANSTVTVDVGAGGAANTPGQDSIVWIHNVTGAVLDPDVDDPDDAFRAIGGGGGDGDNGGSGGGGSAEMPLSGGATHGGGSGTVGQGNDGGDGVDAGGIATCQRSAGGGGGSYAGAGTAGVIPGGPLATPPIAGEGGPSSSVPGWAITLGGGGNGGTNTEPQDGGEGTCGAAVVRPGSSGASGWGAGGGGGADGAGAGAGGAGGVALRYTGPIATLVPPEISGVGVTDLNEAEICIEGESWPPGVPAGYRARVEYALGDYEPADDSGDWRLAGYLDGPGCILTPPVPIGVRVWARAVAEADQYLPSGPSTTTPEDSAGIPGFLGVQLLVTSAGVATLSWTPNSFNGAVRIRRKIHVDGEATTRPLTLVASLDAGDSPYQFADLVPEGSFITVDIEAWEDNTYAMQGQIVRRSVLNPERTIVGRDDGIDALADVVLTDPQPGDLLELDEYGVWVNKPREVVLEETALQESGDPDHFLNGEGDFVPLPNSSGWAEIVAQTDQDVTNNSTLQNDAELLLAVGSGEVYDIELLLVLSGSDTSVDAKTKWTFPSSDGFIANENKGTSGLASQGFQVFGPTATTHPSEIAIGTEATHALVSAWQRLRLSTKASGDVQFQFANNSAALGRVTRRKAGSVLRYRRLV